MLSALRFRSAGLRLTVAVGSTALLALVTELPSRSASACEKAAIDVSSYNDPPGANLEPQGFPGLANSPFHRLPQMDDLANSNGDLGVAKIAAGNYVMLAAEKLSVATPCTSGCGTVIYPSGNRQRFFRYVSTNGIDWTQDPAGCPVFDGKRDPILAIDGVTPIQIPNVKCVDLVESTPNELHMYFNDVPGTMIVHAVSYDQGRCWTGARAVFDAKSCGGSCWDKIVHTPTVIDIAAYAPSFVSANPKKRFIMGYSGLTSADAWEGIGIAYAATWDGPFERYRFPYPHPLGQAFTNTDTPPAGQGGEWQQKCIYRPRLVVRPDTGELTLFYVGAYLGGLGLPRGSIAYATSSTTGAGSWGRCWKLNATSTCVNPGYQDAPIFAGTGNPPDYDSKDTWCPDLINEPDPTSANDPDPFAPNATVRLYYLCTSLDSTVAGGIRVAESPWSDLPSTPAKSDPPTHGDLALRPAVSTTQAPRSFLSAHPNPMTHSVQLSLDLSARSLDGTLELDILDPSGRRVRRLWSGYATTAPAALEWDGQDGRGRAVPSGRYAVVIRRGEQVLETATVSVLR